jgi:hypothetical protein
VQWIPSPTNRAPSTAAMAARPPGCHAAVPGHQEETSSASCSVWAWARWRCRLVLAPTVYQAISAEAWLPSPSPLTLGTCHPDAGHGKLHSLLSCACPAPPDFDSRNQGVVTFTLMVLLCSCSVMLSRSCTSPAHKAKKQSLRLYFGYVTAAYGLLNTVVSLKIHGTILNRA